MKKVRKFIQVSLALILIISMMACSTPSPSTPPDAQTSSQNPATVTTTPEVPAPKPEEAQQEEVQQEEAPQGPAFSGNIWSLVDADGNRITTGRDATGTYAVTSSSKYEVSQVGAEVLAAGGNAIDAAVAMGFAIGVAEPFTNGLGGGGFATIRLASGENYFIDFRERAPAAAHPELFLDETGTLIPNSNYIGGLASGVPGDVAGLLYMLEHWGSMNRQDVMEPSIRMATQGIEISHFFQGATDSMTNAAVEFPILQEMYWSDELGTPLEVGSILTNPGMARALQKISDEGHDGFYKGELAEAIVASINDAGGIFTMEDLANYQIYRETPVSGTYRGFEIISSPPPSSGGAIMILILNMLEQFDVSSFPINSPEYINLWTEIFKLAYADRATYMADTRFEQVPLGGLLSKDFALSRLPLINLGSAMMTEEIVVGDPWEHEGTNTTHYSVADVHGNMVSVTKSINSYWGSGVVVDGFGFIMNNTMADFSVSDTSSVNRVDSGKTPLSSMAPTVVLNADGSPFMAIGTPGGPRIFTMIAQTLSHIIDHGKTINEAVGIPRIFNTAAFNDRLLYTPHLPGFEQYAITQETIDALMEMGHNEPTVMRSGAIQLVMYRPDGTLHGTADPSQDGRAVGVNR